MQAVIGQVPEPEPATAYAAWLVGADGAVRLAGADFSSGTLSISFVDPLGDNLLAQVDEFAVSLEPDPDPAPDVPGAVRFRAPVPPELLGEIRRLDELSNGEPTSARILRGLTSEASTHDSHLGFSVTAARGDNLGGAKLHAEHTINILEGEASSAYGDWDQNGRAENPGDHFGLIAYLHLAQAMVQSELQDPDITTERRTTLEPLLGDLQATIDLAQDSSRLAQRLVVVDTIDEIAPLEEEWNGSLLTPAVSDLAARLQEAGLRSWIPIVPVP
jgi:hypothetical protein